MDASQETEHAVIGEIQLLLAEKRTSLAVMRTGIAVLALPLSVLGLLVATSKYYESDQVLHLLVPVVVLCALLVVLGGYLVIHSMRRLHRQEKMILRIKQRHPVLRDVIV